MASWPVPQVPQPGRENSDTRRLLDNLGQENEQMRAELAEMRAMLSGRLTAEQAPPEAAQPEHSEDALAAALAGASVDQGPSSQFE
jgi:hypothetical protein